MLKKTISTLILVIIFNSVAFVQNVCQTEIEAGIFIAKFSERWKYYDLNNTSFSLEIHKALNKNDEQRFSLAKNIGVGLKYSSLDKPDSGTAMGGWSETNGGYLHTIISLSLLPQFRLGEKSIIQIGPYFEQLIIGYQNTESEWWQMEGIGSFVSGHEKISEFNRDHFNEPYYGIILKYFYKEGEKNANGISLGYLLTKGSDSNFNTKKVIRVSFVIRI